MIQPCKERNRRLVLSESCKLIYSNLILSAQPDGTAKSFCQSVSFATGGPVQKKKLQPRIKFQNPRDLKHTHLLEVPIHHARAFHRRTDPRRRLPSHDVRSFYTSRVHAPWGHSSQWLPAHGSSTFAYHRHISTAYGCIHITKPCAHLPDALHELGHCRSRAG